jgi:phage protein D
MHAEIMSLGSCKSSRFELTASISGDASDQPWLSLLSERVTVEIYIGTEGTNSESSMFTGLTDSIAIDPIAKIALLTGRDYSSVLVNSTYQDSFCNQTASEIANHVAMRHGFSPNISTTSAMIGSYQGGGYNQVLLNTHSKIVNEWDLLIHLAKSEGFEMFVDENALVFSAAELLQTNKVCIGVDDVISMKFHKTCPVSNQNMVTVKSWNSWLDQTLNYSDNQLSGQDPASVIGLSADPGTEMAIVRPNLTPEAAERLARQHVNALNEQALTVQITMPGELLLKPRDILTVCGTRSVFDTNFVVRSVRRHFSTTAGFVQYIQGFAMGLDSPLVASNGSS